MSIFAYRRYVVALFLSMLTVTASGSETLSVRGPLEPVDRDSDRIWFQIHKMPDPRFQIGLSTAFSTGESAWEISFIEEDPMFGFVRGRSRLEWEDLKSIVYRVQAEYRITSWLRVDGAYAFGDIDDGKNTDTDWLTGLARRDFVFSQSIADTSGDLSMIDLNIYLRLNKVYDLSWVGGVWDAFLGYQYHKEDLRDRNGVQTIFIEEIMNDPF